MEKLDLKSLKSLRAAEKKKINSILKEGKVTVILVGTGTCGLAAGAGETLKAFSVQIDRMGLKDVELKQTGCMGKCSVEPMVEVRVPGMPEVIYGRVTPEIAAKILERHVVQKILLNDSIFDKPAIDILK